MQQREGGSKLLRALWDALRLEDLRNKILFTVFILVVFRFIAHVPLPGVDLKALGELFSRNQILGMLDLFSGGAMRNFSVAAMGVYPYITSSIIVTLLVPVIPYLRNMSQEGEAGRHRVNVLTHWLTVPLAALQGYAQIALLRSQGVLLPADIWTTLTIVVSLTAGTILLMWLGELITERGIGNGISVIIFGGIVASIPQTIGQGLISRDNLTGLAIYLIMGLAMVYLIVVFTEAHRRLPVQYSKSVIKGGRMYKQAGSSFIPLRVNSAGMIPLIFAIAIVVFPSTVASYLASPPNQDPNFANTVMDIFNPNAALPLGFIYWGIYFLMVIAFSFFYTTVIYQEMDLAKSLQNQGGFIPGIRPGKPTTEYINNVIGRITWGGAFFLALVAIMPFFVRSVTDAQLMTISSTGLLIIIGVALDTMKQIEAQLLMRRYEGFLK